MVHSCSRCGKEHDGVFGSGKFCSRACANSRVFTAEARLKKSIAHKAYQESLPPAQKAILLERKLTRLRSAYFASLQDRKALARKTLLEEDFSTLKWGRLRARVFVEQENKCNRCGLSEWMSSSLVLEIDHKDGNHSNNARENIEGLCPNCHSITPTWRGRNKPGLRRVVVSEEKIVEMFLETGSIHQCLLQLGLAAKGANYGRVKKALTQANIPYERVLG